MRKTPKNNSESRRREVILETIDKSLDPLLKRVFRNRLVVGAIKKRVISRLENISDDPKAAGKEIGDQITKYVRKFLNATLSTRGEKYLQIAKPLAEGVRQTIILNLMTEEEKKAIGTLNEMITKPTKKPRS